MMIWRESFDLNSFQRFLFFLVVANLTKTYKKKEWEIVPKTAPLADPAKKFVKSLISKAEHDI